MVALPGWMKKHKRADEIGGQAASDVLNSGKPITGRSVLRALLSAAINVLLGRAARKV